MGSFQKAAAKTGGCCSSALAGFRDFCLKGTFLDVAIGFVIGGAFKDLINSFVAAFISPLIGMIGGKDYKDLCFTANGSAFCYGLFIDQLITFFILVLLVYFCVVYPLNSIMARVYPNRVLVRDCPECLSDDVPAAATRCKHCCAPITKLIKNPDAEATTQVNENFA